MTSFYQSEAGRIALPLHRRERVTLSGCADPEGSLHPVTWVPMPLKTTRLYVTLLQEFFYHVLLTLDSYTFNSRLKTVLSAEIATLHDIPSEGKRDMRKDDDAGEDAKLSGRYPSKSTGDGVEGFTGRLVKLKVSECRLAFEFWGRYSTLLHADLPQEWIIVIS